MFCPTCGLQQPDDHRYCVACGRVLPTGLIRPRQPKVTNLFLGFPTHPQDAAEPVLRVSRYIEDVEIETAEGSVTIPGRHTRFSIWVVDRPVCAMSLGDSEVERLARFLLTPVGAQSGVEQPASSAESG